MRQDEWILAGVDGTQAGHAAVRYAAAEAHLSGARLHLAHVLPDLEPHPTTLPARDPLAEPSLQPALRRHGRLVLAEARRQALEVLPPSQVATVLLAGYRVQALLLAASGASLVVLGDERRAFLNRIATASVLSDVAAHAPVPVVAVPADWRPASVEHPRVVAAIRDWDDAAGVVEQGLREAEVRRAVLVLLHAWRLPPAYDGVIGSEVDPDTWEQAAREALEHIMDTMPAASPDVDVQIAVRRGQAARVLVDASKDADLLLITRRPHGFPFGHLGGNGRAVLRESHCPVEVLPPRIGTVAGAHEDDDHQPGTEQAAGTPSITRAAGD